MSLQTWTAKQALKKAVSCLEAVTGAKSARAVDKKNVRTALDYLNMVKTDLDAIGGKT